MRPVNRLAASQRHSPITMMAAVVVAVPVMMVVIGRAPRFVAVGPLGASETCTAGGIVAAEPSD